MENQAVIEGEMALRDYFAAKAMAAQIANSHIVENYGAVPEVIACEAYKYADAMMIARRAS